MSEIITDANVTSLIRSIIDEATAKHWEDAEIALYKKFGMMSVESKYWYLLAPREARVVTASLVAITPYIEMPGASVGAASYTAGNGGLDDATFGGVYEHRADLTYQVVIDGTSTPNTFKWSKDGGTTFEVETVSITGSVQTLDNGVTVTFTATTGHTTGNLWESACVSTSASKILRVEVAETRRLLRKIEPDELWKYSVSDDGSASSDYLNVWYIKQKSTVGDFPEALRPLIAMEAIVFAKTKDDAMRVNIEQMHRRFESTAITFLSTDSMYEPTIFGDYEQEQAYTRDNPCAWIMRDGKIYLLKSYSED